MMDLVKRNAEIVALVKARKMPMLDEQQQTEALKRLAAGESCRAVARAFDVHPSTVSKLAR